MPTLPASPAPLRVSAPQLIDPVLIQVFDQGYEHRRSRYSRGYRRFTVEYFLTSNDLHTIIDFFERQTRGGALSFDWVYPYQHSIATISNGTPNVVTTTYNHGFQTNDQVTITSTASHNNTYVITRTSATAFSLNGTSGGSSEVIGNVSLYFPYMVVIASDAVPAINYTEGFGALQNDSGLFSWNIVIEERFG